MVKNTVFAAAAAFALVAPQAFASPSNLPPPVGNVIYELTGQTMSGAYQQGSATFTADSASTNLAFAFRDDFSYIYLSSVQMVDQTNPGGNLLINGDLYGTSAQPDGWTYLNTFGAGFGGQSYSDCGFSTATSCYKDGAVQAYDAISQVVATTAGDTYEVSFYYYGDGSGTYQPLSTNGDVTDSQGNGQDMFVYAGASAPVSAPEPASLALLASGILGMTFLRRRRIH